MSNISFIRWILKALHDFLSFVSLSNVCFSNTLHCLFCHPLTQLVRYLTQCSPLSFLCECSILQAFFPHYVFEKFQLLLYDSKYKIFSKHSRWLHAPSMAFFTSFSRTTSLLVQVFPSSVNKFPAIYKD